MALQLNVGEFSKPASMEQVEEEYTRLEVLTLSYWMRYELYLGIRDPYVIGDEMQRKLAAIMRSHEERERVLAQRKQEGQQQP